MDGIPAPGRTLLDADGFKLLIEAIRRRGYRIAGPKALGGALCYEELGSGETLAAGARDEQAPAGAQVAGVLQVEGQLAAEQKDQPA